MEVSLRRRAASWQLSHYRVRSRRTIALPRRDTIRPDQHRRWHPTAAAARDAGRCQPFARPTSTLPPRDRWTDGNLVAAPLHESRGEIHTASGQPRAPSILTISEAPPRIAHQRGRVALARAEKRLTLPQPITRAAAVGRR